MEFTLNNQKARVPEDWRDESLLFLLREAFGLTGAKYGCGVGQCGACTVIIDGAAARSCLIKAKDIEGTKIRTIEGLAAGDDLHPVQKAWIDISVPQCGYCQAGQIMSAVALLEEAPTPTADEIVSAMEGNLCRCGTYDRIRTAIRAAAEMSS